MSPQRPLSQSKAPGSRRIWPPSGFGGHHQRLEKVDFAPIGRSALTLPSRVGAARAVSGVDGGAEGVEALAIETARNRSVGGCAIASPPSHDREEDLKRHHGRSADAQRVVLRPPSRGGRVYKIRAMENIVLLLTRRLGHGCFHHHHRGAPRRPSPRRRSSEEARSRLVRSHVRHRPRAQFARRRSFGWVPPSRRGPTRGGGRPTAARTAQGVAPPKSQVASLLRLVSGDDRVAGGPGRRVARRAPSVSESSSQRCRRRRRRRGGHGRRRARPRCGGVTRGSR